MTAPHPFTRFVLPLLSAFLAADLSRVRADAGSVCVPPPLLAPTGEPPLAERFPPPQTKPMLGTAEPQDPPAPIVILRVRVPASAVAGQELAYRLCVENCSTA